jgi:hypothetical protein
MITGRRIEAFQTGSQYVRGARVDVAVSGLSSDPLLVPLVIADVHICCFVRHFAVLLFQEVFYVINDASYSPFGGPY